MRVKKSIHGSHGSWYVSRNYWENDGILYNFLYRLLFDSDMKTCLTPPNQYTSASSLSWKIKVAKHLFISHSRNPCLHHIRSKFTNIIYRQSITDYDKRIWLRQQERFLARKVGVWCSEDFSWLFYFLCVSAKWFLYDVHLTFKAAPINYSNDACAFLIAGLHWSITLTSTYEFHIKGLHRIPAKLRTPTPSSAVALLPVKFLHVTGTEAAETTEPN